MVRVACLCALLVLRGEGRRARVAPPPPLRPPASSVLGVLPGPGRVGQTPAANVPTQHASPHGQGARLAGAAGVAGRQPRTRVVALKDKMSDPNVVKFIERHVVDEEAMMKSQESFPIPPDELIDLAKYFLATESPEATVPGNGAMLADNFRFVGPVIGPLNAEDFAVNLKGIEFFDVFPDATSQFHHFRVDPFEPSRVWYTARGKGTNTGRAQPGTDTEMLVGEPTGKQFINAPQACSLKFNEKGLVEQFTIGYVMDRYIGNTGGLGGFFGPLYAIGKNFPFDEGKPWRPSLGYQLYIKTGAFFNRLRNQLSGKPAVDGIYMPKGSDEVD